MGDRTRTSETESALDRCIGLGEFTIDVPTGTVSGPAGRVQLDPKVMDVLVALAERAGRVVSRRELLDEVWPRAVVGDDALTRCIYQLRRQLSRAGGNDSHKTLLETLPKRGYRLNLEAPTMESEPADARAGSPQALARITRFMSSRFVATSIIVLAAVLGIALFVSERAPLHAVPTENPQAYDAYVRASEYFHRPDRHVALPHAETLYRRATNLDPKFALAWVGLARTHSDIYWQNIDRSETRLELAKQAVDLAFAMSPGLAEAHLARANYLFKGLGRFDESLKELETAEKSIPRDPELFFLRAMVLRRLAEWDLAIEALDQALALDSKSILYLRQQHISYLFLRRYAEAEEYLDRIEELVPDDGTTYVDRVVLALCRDGDTTLARQYEAAAPSAFYDDGLAYTYTSWLAAIFDRDYERATRFLDDSVEDWIFDGDFRNSSYGPKALYYARTYRLAGRDEKAREAFRSVVSKLEAEPPNDVEDNFLKFVGWRMALAESYAALGQHDRALSAMRHTKKLVSESHDDMMSSAARLASVTRVLIPAGYADEALDELDAYLRDVGHWSIEGLLQDPRLDPIRDHPRLKSLQEKYKRS